MQLQDAETEDEVASFTEKDDMLMLLAQAGFANEMLRISKKHRACQCMLTQIVFKGRRVEIKQLEEGLESLLLITFLQVSEGCLKYALPLQGEVQITGEDFIHHFENEQDAKEGEEKIAEQWFAQYVQEVAEGIGTIYFKTHIVSLHWSPIIIHYIFLEWWKEYTILAKRVTKILLKSKDVYNVKND